MVDDKNDIDDFDDFDDLDEFDDFSDEAAFDEDDSLSSFEDVDGDVEETASDGVVDEKLVSEGKESFLSKFSFNQIVIFGAVLLGGIVLFFQLSGSKPPVNPDSFTSSLNMSGATDSLVFRDETRNAKKNTAVDPQENIPTNANSGLLNNADALDSLEINFEDDVPMPVPISSEGALDDEDILLKGVEDNKGDVTIAAEFDTPSPEGAIQAPNGFGADVFSAVDDPIENSVTGPVLDSLAITTPETDTSVAITPTDAKDVAVVLEENPDAELEILTNRVTAQPLNKVSVNEPESDMADNKAEMADTPDVLKIENSESQSNQTPMFEKKLAEITAEKDQKISDLENTIADLQKQIEAMKAADEKPQMAEKPAPKKQAVASKPKAPVKKAQPKTVQWELRAAQPGKAWVAQKGRSDLQPVIVGDTLSGLGRITSITFVNNSWIVVGQNGSIKQ